MSLENRITALLYFLNSERIASKNPEYSKIIRQHVDTVKELREMINQLQSQQP